MNADENVIDFDADHLGRRQENSSLASRNLHALLGASPQNGTIQRMICRSQLGLRNLTNATYDRGWPRKVKHLLLKPASNIITHIWLDGVSPYQISLRQSFRLEATIRS